MESADFIPGKAFDAGKCIKRLHLRNSRGKDHTDGSTGFGQFPESFRGGLSGGDAGRLAVRMNLHIYVSYLKVLHFFHGGLKLLSNLALAPGKRGTGARKEPKRASH
jgi:hypothetical protein